MNEITEIIINYINDFERHSSIKASKLYLGYKDWVYIRHCMDEYTFSKVDISRKRFMGLKVYILENKNHIGIG
ncbi:MAG: hypothetical protein GQ540_03270 [Lutibacter sp.]|uniref:hypothetical protein n=1 Tax=Lutibacter sp. TaxID=1925666 RepID=UPI0019EF315A|nr:hypothetical protein [Lutibacter sp.]NOR27532.1 hypothetical protein [Lutibacter sp.]